MGSWSRRRTETGAAAVEFALVMLPVVVLLFGLVQYGFYFWAMQGGSDVARGAARLSAVGQPATCAAFRAAVESQVDGLVASGTTPTIQRSYVKQNGSTVSIGDTVEVLVTFKSVDLHFPFIPFIHDGRVTARAEARVDFVPLQPEICL